MKFSYSAVWDDTIQLIRSNASVLVALAGVFIFLPALLIAYFLPEPVAATIPQLFKLMEGYFAANWHWLLLANLTNMVGALAMLLLLFGRGGPTVGNAIAVAFAILPFYFLASAISGIMTGLGLALFIVPGAYLFGRMATIGPVMVAENRRNPIDAIRRSFEVTRSNGWAVIGLILIVAFAAFVVTLVISSVFGSIFILTAGKEFGGLLALIVRAVLSAAFSTVMIVLFAAIYRRLSGRESAAAAAY